MAEAVVIEKPASGLLAKKKLIAGLFVVILLASSLYFLIPKGTSEPEIEPWYDLPENYVVTVDEPMNEEQMLLAACAARLAVRGEQFHPFFILRDGVLTDYQSWTLLTMGLDSAPMLHFTFQDIPEPQDGANGSITLPLTKEMLLGIKGFDGHISVGSYEEALWVAPLTETPGQPPKMLVPGTSTYSSQEDVWAVQKNSSFPFNYVVVTNPQDWGGKDIFYTSGTVLTDGMNNALPEPKVYNASFHIPKLSIVSIPLAIHHGAYVLTHWENSTQDIGYMDLELNTVQIGLHLKLKNMYSILGPMEYICIVGSAEAVPQFELPDETASTPEDIEGDGHIDCDVIYGFLDDDPYTMDVAVGRIVNAHVFGASNQITRTLGYDMIGDTVEVESTSGTTTINWRTHASAWNGYEVADQRRQMTPSRYAVEDFRDEGWTYDYMRVYGNGAWVSENNREMEFEPVMESSNIIVYRGHGSWHATFYVYEPENQGQPQSKDRLEGNDTENHPNSPSVTQYNLPPQVGVLVSCENAKIRGANFGGGVVDMDKLFSTHYFEAGAVGLIAATEVSFSNIGQDIYSRIGRITGDHQWDLNNCWFGYPLDALINHEEEYGSIGKAHQWAENRYIAGHKDQYDLTPFEPAGGEAHWKEMTMFVCLGDPAFVPSPTSPGANSADEWHNGPDDM